MGVVYLGWDPRLGRPVAVKTLRPERVQDINARDRFLEEARAVAAISHPNVTQIHDIGEQDGSIWFAMEYLEGIALDRMLAEQGPLTAERAVDLVRQAACGLEAAAERGIIHRDIKPGNLVLSADGKLKVTDFGLAKRTAGDTAVTSSTVFIGTPDYIAPERAAGEPVDLRSDIYSLGATLYELVTGQPPFSGPNPVAVISKHLRDPVPPPREIRSGLSYPLNLLILRMLSKDPAARPQDYAELVRQLDRLPVETPTEVESPAVAAADVPPVRRSW
ncbi:MAG: protein kinase, partial [Gemmatimonadetes bacterium]|nr:serine/threonine protein kinase [Gemmatimonadota bacterium]NIU78584.1 protein kinase [Gammaproteobacteria bacterium]NIX47423.1 protein kinase [Gemmatimonadota bacterium]